MINKLRAKMLISALWEHREKFLMDVFISYRLSGGIEYIGEVPQAARNLECGTACCMAGMAAILSKRPAGKIHTIAQNWLELGNEEADWLFYARWHKDIPMHEIPLHRAITAIEWLLLYNQVTEHSGSEWIKLFLHGGAWASTIKHEIGLSCHKPDWFAYQPLKLEELRS